MQSWGSLASRGRERHEQWLEAHERATQQHDGAMEALDRKLDHIADLVDGDDFAPAESFGSWSRQPPQEAAAARRETKLAMMLL